ncbi:MAG: gamma-glutamyl-gamma-aminobutyrate hydrolase family protein [Saprospiraceae bacterium]|nr:gamma-glutamyl-gamma-aminobutyrate hydrolase family protein [Pyrinomonadaceae bacterium]
MANIPRIGVTMRLDLETRRFYLGRDYSEALEAAGAVPVHIALIPKTEYIAEILKDLDGILLPGSDSDVDPEYYGEDPHPKLGRVVPEKDQTDLMVLAEAERLDLPVLGICFGMQSLNVSRGGSLIQDIASQIDDPIKHEQGIPRERNSHSIRIEPGTILESLAGKGSGQVKVNSHHHQAIKTVGKELSATGWTNDGIIECIEDTRDNRFVLGVQWHPELSWNSDALSKAIFDSFVRACSEKVFKVSPPGG